VVNVVGHGVGLKLVEVAFEFDPVDELPAASADDEFVEEIDPIGDVENGAVLLHEPLHPLAVGQLRIVVLLSEVAHHEEELFQKGETVIVVNPVDSTQGELRQYFEAVSVEHPQEVQDVLKVSIAGIVPVELCLAVELVEGSHGLLLSLHVQSHESSPHLPRGQALSQPVQLLLPSDRLRPLEDHCKRFVWAFLYYPHLVVTPDAACVLHQGQVEALLCETIRMLLQLVANLIDEVHCCPMRVSLLLETLEGGNNLIRTKFWVDVQEAVVYLPFWQRLIEIAIGSFAHESIPVAFHVCS
jgi:hypothetical protein